MQVNVESTGALTRQLRVEIPAEEFEREYQRRIRQVASRVRVPGFRPGKAPITVIQQKYGESAKADAISELMRRSFPDAISQAGVSPAGVPTFELESEPPASPLTYIARFDVLPEIKLRSVEGLSVEQPKVDVTDGDVDRLIENLRKAKRKWEPANRPAAVGDQCRVDFVGTVDGTTFPGGTAENIVLEIGAGQFLPDLETALVGHSVGEQFVAGVDFPDDYQEENLRGKNAEFAVTMREVNTSDLPAIDGEFLKAHGLDEAASESELRAKCRSALEGERDKAIRNRLKAALFNQLQQANPIEVPPSRVRQEIERMRQDAIGQTGMAKAGRNLDPQKAAEILPDSLFEERARSRVALGLILSELVREHAITIDEDRVKTTLETLAKDYDNPGELIRYYRSTPEAMNGLRSAVLEEQVVDYLLAKVQRTDTGMTLEALLHWTA